MRLGREHGAGQHPGCSGGCWKQEKEGDAQGKRSSCCTSCQLLKPGSDWSLPTATGRTRGGRGDTALGTQLGMAVAPGADGVFWRFQARRAQPPSHLPSCTSPPAHGAGPAAATHPFWGHQCPTGTTPVTASPSGDHASSRKRWHRSHCPPAPPARPGLAQEKNGPLCATIARLSPEPPGPFPPAPGSCPTRSAPSRALLLPPGQWARPPRAPHTCAPGCPAPALRHCPRGVSHGGYFKAELPLPRRGPVAGQGGAAKPRATRLAGNRQQHREPPWHLPGDPSAMGLLR